MERWLRVTHPTQSPQPTDSIASQNSPAFAPCSARCPHRRVLPTVLIVVNGEQRIALISTEDQLIRECRECREFWAHGFRR